MKSSLGSDALRSCDDAIKPQVEKLVLPRACAPVCTFVAVSCTYPSRGWRQIASAEVFTAKAREHAYKAGDAGDSRMKLADAQPAQTVKLSANPSRSGPVKKQSERVYPNSAEVLAADGGLAPGQTWEQGPSCSGKEITDRPMPVSYTIPPTASLSRRLVRACAFPCPIVPFLFLLASSVSGCGRCRSARSCQCWMPWMRPWWPGISRAMTVARWSLPPPSPQERPPARAITRVISSAKGIFTQYCAERGVRRRDGGWWRPDGWAGAGGRIDHYCRGIPRAQ